MASDRVRTLAIGWLLYAGFILSMACFGLPFILAGLIVTQLPEQAGQAPPFWFGVAFASFGAFFSALVVFASIPTLVGAWGLYRNYAWAWILILMLAVWHFFSMPLGTALSLWTLHVLYTEGMPMDFSWLWRRPPPASPPDSPSP